MAEFKTPWGKKLGRNLKIFGVPWHVAHQYELLKLPETEWYFLINPTRYWGTMARPVPENLTWVPEYKPGEYDMALLHVDQQCVHEPIGKGKLFRELHALIQDIPKILINHGTPYWPEMMGEREIVEKMENMIGDLKENCVVNSKEAANMWGFGTFIQHGMDPEEWLDLPKEPRIVTCISPGGLDAYYNRALMREVKDQLRNDYNIKHCHMTVDWRANSWDDYKRFLGSSLIYFNPTFESPMPRARTEAMLSGAAVVTLNNHGIGDYIEDGKSGFFVKNNPKSCVDKLVELFYDYKKCIEVGQEGRKVALEHFSKENFQQQWITHISNVLDL